MIGGGNRRDEGSFKVSSTNGFAALESLRKKKKSNKEKGSSKGSKGTSKSKAEENPPVYWAPAPLTTKLWADVDDEDDDDYYATTAPPQVLWGGSGVSNREEIQKPDLVEESESEDELLDEGDYDVDEEHEPEPEEQEQHESMLTNPVEVPAAPKETERQLSKKEIKKKELEELDAILADLGVNPKIKVEDEPSDATKEEGKMNGDAEKNSAPAESKSAKKKKKKDKSSKEVKEPEDESNSLDVPNGQDETARTEMPEEDQSAVDVKERLKKVAAAKKKKSSKETDASAKAAAEAAARSKKLAAAKKKEKNHYNQQPMR